MVLFGILLSQLPLVAQDSKQAGEFVIGNRLISRAFRIEKGGVFSQALRGRASFNVTSKEFEFVCEQEGREVVLNGRNTAPKGYTMLPSGRDAMLAWSSNEPPLEIRVNYRADGSRPYIFKTLEIANRGERPVHLMLVTVEALEVERDVEPLRGGVGQPVLLRNELFLGIEHPAAANQVLGQAIELSHYPDAAVAPGETWVSKRAVLGAAAEPGESVEDAFRNYLVAVTGRMPKARPIYCDWAAHDELGTLLKPQLTEELVNSLLDILQSMKSSDGTQFSYYLMDAFWYDPQGAFVNFKKPNWPRGYELAAQRMLKLGMKPGLWFDLGGSTLDLKNTPGWRGPEKPCLSDPQFSELLEHAFEVHVREHSLAMLKFDFANMLCHHDGDASASLAILERNADAFRKICEEARRLNPEMLIRAYNGFGLSEMMSSTKRWDEAYAISPWWLFWFDSVYSGDPRPSELPSVTSLRDSVNWYQDHVYRGYARSLMPSFMIDDCGTLVGKTSTIYYLGAEGFTDSWLLNIVRSGLMPTFYGDLRLLTERDRKFMAATLRFLRDHEKLLANTQPILGIPGKGEVYGYLAREGELALVSVVNPSLFAQSYSVTVPNPPARSLRKLLFSNDGRVREEIQPTTGVLNGSLAPGEIRVYAVGPQMRIEPLSLPPAPTRQYHEVTRISDPFGDKKEAEIQIRPEQVGTTLAVIVHFQKGGEPDRSYDRPQEVMKLSGALASRPIRFSTIPQEGTDIWSRCSWAVFKHRIEPDEANQTLKLTWVGDPPAGTTVTIRALWLR
jgi:hypothetical protein